LFSLFTAIVCAIANLHHLLKQDDEADKQYKSAIENLRAADHPSLAMALKMYADFLSSIGRSDDAAKAEAESKSVAEKYKIRIWCVFYHFLSLSLAFPHVFLFIDVLVRRLDKVTPSIHIDLAAMLA